MAEIAKNSSEVDLAYQVLAEKGSALNFRELISMVLDAKGRPQHSRGHAMAEVHTQINMDSRFVHLGKGMWGLAEWLPQKGGARNAEDTAATVSDLSLRREKLLAEIQQDYPAAALDAEESE
ncbi:MAG: DNA-directed RNA polymerase subunit delta [Negativicutes bacterium]|nr:DNA-directed RNA polymerase subunit delta [Negativicutes bacterium]